MIEDDDSCKYLVPWKSYMKVTVVFRKLLKMKNCMGLLFEKGKEKET